MASLHADSLTIIGFRGVRRRLDLHFGNRLTIIYGGNATGKSSIAQAIEFVLSGQVLDHEDSPIPARYLNNATDSSRGTVALRMRDSNSVIPLNAATDEARNQIEQRFRTAASVDWPERQHLPITTTHITSQGALARVLGADSVTRNDLSGLCAGSYLRFLVTRAERLSDQFRQAATGRNMQSAIKDARGAYEASRLLRESLAATRTPDALSSEDLAQRVRHLAGELGLTEVVSIAVIVAAIDRRLEEIDRKLGSIQSLLSRMRELGQYEVELTQLRTLVNDGVISENALLTRKDEISSSLEKQRAKENEILARQAQGVATIAAYERYQQSVSLIDSLAKRLTQAQADLVGVEEHIASLTTSLQTSVADQREKSERAVALEGNRRRAQRQLEAVTAGLAALNLVSEESVDQSKGRVVETEKLVAQLRLEEEAASGQLRGARDTERTAEETMKQVSEESSRFLAAVSELRSFIDGDACPLCGHHHGTDEALHSAIDQITNRQALISSQQRDEFDRASIQRREIEATCAQIQARVRTAETTLAQARQVADRLDAQRLAAVVRTQESLTREGLSLVVSMASLAKAKDDLTSTLDRLKSELEAANQSSQESTTVRNDLEQELAARTAERGQISRLVGELQEQVAAARRSQPEDVSVETLTSARHVAAAADSGLAEVRREIGGASAELTEIERALADRIAQRAGAQRRLDVIEELLRSVDAELKAVGATRDVTVLVELEGNTRRQRDEAGSLKARGQSLQQQLNEIEKHRAYVMAETQFRAAAKTVEQLQARQTKLSRRGEQFAALRLELEKIQSSTAEAVLNNVRTPVGLMFRAMTAGCQWDIEFRLDDDGRVEAKLVDGAGRTLPASALLNSAYLNISAIALRIALASQQNWTSLRTVVLDDPILEMDSLTQSALIDGLEAILVSPHSPWRNLQFIITTWSEDFAVLAAHKLAHLNAGLSQDAEDFVIYGLGSQPDGTVVPERHIPRWKAQASAA
jgi:exonuclease SbcC